MIYPNLYKRVRIVKDVVHRQRCRTLFLFEIGNLYISDIANGFAILTIDFYFFIIKLT